MTRNVMGGIDGFLLLFFQVGAAEAVDATISIRFCEPLTGTVAGRIGEAFDGTTVPLC